MPATRMPFITSSSSCSSCIYASEIILSHIILYLTSVVVCLHFVLQSRTMFATARTCDLNSYSCCDAAAACLFNLRLFPRITSYPQNPENASQERDYCTWGLNSYSCSGAAASSSLSTSGVRPSARACFTPSGSSSSPSSSCAPGNCAAQAVDASDHVLIQMHSNAAGQCCSTACFTSSRDLPPRPVPPRTAWQRQDSPSDTWKLL